MNDRTTLNYGPRPALDAEERVELVDRVRIIRLQYPRGRGRYHDDVRTSQQAALAAEYGICIRTLQRYARSAGVPS